MHDVPGREGRRFFLCYRNLFDRDRSLLRIEFLLHNLLFVLGDGIDCRARLVLIAALLFIFHHSLLKRRGSQAAPPPFVTRLPCQPNIRR